LLVGFRGVSLEIKDMPDQESEEEMLQRLRYRFNGYRYTLRSPDKRGPNDIIPEIRGLYAFPNVNNTENDDREPPAES